MINGKFTYLSGNQLVNLLKGTSSNTVSRIEIIANPSSKYDAAGKGGIINIIMKKNVKTGFNGTVSANGGAGRGARAGGGTSLNLSYRFGGESAAARQRTTGSEELKGRMK